MTSYTPSFQRGQDVIINLLTIEKWRRLGFINNCEGIVMLIYCERHQDSKTDHSLLSLVSFGPSVTVRDCLLRVLKTFPFSV